MKSFMNVSLHDDVFSSIYDAQDNVNIEWRGRLVHLHLSWYERVLHGEHAQGQSSNTDKSEQFPCRSCALGTISLSKRVGLNMNV